MLICKLDKVSSKEINKKMGSNTEKRTGNYLSLAVICNADENRSSHLICSIKKIVFKNFSKFTRKHLSRNLFFIKCRPCLQIYCKKRQRQRCFPKDFEKILSTPILKNICKCLFCKKKRDFIQMINSFLVHFAPHIALTFDLCTF